MEKIYRALIDGRPFEFIMHRSKEGALQSAIDRLKFDLAEYDFLGKPNKLKLNKNSIESWIVDAYQVKHYSPMVDYSVEIIILIQEFSLM